MTLTARFALKRQSALEVVASYLMTDTGGVTQHLSISIGATTLSFASMWKIVILTVRMATLGASVQNDRKDTLLYLVTFVPNVNL